MRNDKRAVVHLDMDAYFASVEQRSNPLIRGKPVIFTGKGNRTVVTTASYEGRKYGIKTGMTLAQARRLCPHVIRIAGNPEKYIYTTLKIREALIHFTDQVELYSIDEFFLDITHSQSIFGPSEEIVRKIKDAVRNATELPCSCGLAPNKLLAKLASEMNKPDGLTVIRAEEVADLLRDLLIEKLHGIGRKMRAHLNHLGISKAGELGDAPLNLLTSHFGICGHTLKSMGRGIDNSPVPCYWQRNEAKSMGHSYTLPADTSDPDLIKSYIRMLCQKVAERLRWEQKTSRTVVLTIKYSDFEVFSRRKTVDYIIETSPGIYHVCLRILQGIGDLPKSVRMLGVSVTSLTEELRQLYLLKSLEMERNLHEVMGEINSRFGDFTIKPASLLLVEKSRMSV